MYNFTFASPQETQVCGAERPGYCAESVDAYAVWDWIDYMQNNGVVGVVCLLPQEQLDYYEEPLLEAYREAFGDDMVCWAPVEDFHLIDPATLKDVILPFLDEAASLGMRVVVHCSGGIGRTGIVLAAWLVHHAGLGVEDALQTVEKMKRCPREVVHAGNATKEELAALLESVRES